MALTFVPDAPPINPTPDLSEKLSFVPDVSSEPQITSAKGENIVPSIINTVSKEPEGTGQFLGDIDANPREETMTERGINAVLGPVGAVRELSGNPLTSALAAGALDTVLAGTPEATAKLAGASADEFSPQNQHPGFYKAGQLGGVAVPLGEVVKGAQGGAKLTQAALNAARTGLVMGAGRGVSNEALKDNPDLNEALSSGSKEAAINGTISALLPVAAAPVKMAISKILSSASNQRTPQLIEAALLADKAGVPLTAAERTGSRPLAKIQKLLEHSAFSTGEMQAHEKEQYNSILNIANKIVGKFGPKKAPTELGEEIQSAIAKESDAFKKEAGALYGAVNDQIPAGTGVAFNSTQAQSAKILSELSEVAAPARDASVAAFARELSGLGADSLRILNALPTQEQKLQFLKATLPTFTWNGAQLTRSKLGDLIQEVGATTQKGRYLTILKNAIDQDMKTFAESHPGDIKDSFDLANKYYESGKGIFSDPKVQGLIRARPESVYELLVGKNSKEAIQNIKAILGPEKFKNVQRLYLDQILFPANSGEFSPARFVTSLNKFETETLDEVLGDKTRKSLENLAKVAQASKGAEAVASNPSGTAQALISAKSLTAPITAAVGGIVTGHPVAGAISSALIILGPKMASKVYLSPRFEKLMSEGLALPANSPAAQRIASEIIALAQSEKPKQNINDVLAKIGLDKPINGSLKAPIDKSTWEKRADGSEKGMGWKGLIQRPDGKVMSEFSVSTELKDSKGNRVDFPTIVPSSTKDEIDVLKQLNPGDKIPVSIILKAEQFAKERLAQGKSPFASDSESPATPR